MGLAAAFFLFVGILLVAAQMGAFQTSRAQVERLERLSKQIEQGHHISTDMRRVLEPMLKEAQTICPPGKCDSRLSARRSAAIERIEGALRNPKSGIAATSPTDAELLTGQLK